MGPGLRSLFKWDPPNDAFLSFAPGVPGVLNTLKFFEYGDGLWVLMDEPRTWEQPPPGPVPLKPPPGGFPVDNAKPPQEPLPPPGPTPGELAETRSCDEEGTIRPIEGVTRMSLTFANQTDGEVRVQWLDYSGNRVHYNTLAVAESYTQPTFLTHPWIALDADGNCLGLWLPESDGLWAIIRPFGDDDAEGFFARPFAGDYALTSFFDHRFPGPHAAAEAGTLTPVDAWQLTWEGTSYDAMPGHRGYDWSLPVGTDLLTVADGVVSDQGLVAIDVTAGGNSYQVVYVHTSEVLVAAGDEDRQGDVIARSGSSGCALGPTLHFRVWRLTNTNSGGSTVVDPYGWSGDGPDPWAEHADGAQSPRLWLPDHAPALNPVAPQLVTLETTAQGGTVSRDLDAVAYPIGTFVGLTATPVPGQRFSHWQGTGSFNCSPYRFALFDDRVQHAVFVPLGTPDPVNADPAPTASRMSPAIDSVAFVDDRREYRLSASAATGAHIDRVEWRVCGELVLRWDEPGRRGWTEITATLAWAFERASHNEIEGRVIDSAGRTQSIHWYVTIS